MSFIAQEPKWKRLSMLFFVSVATFFVKIKNDRTGKSKQLMLLIMHEYAMLEVLHIIVEKCLFDAHSFFH
jgi:hypothetical protein